MKKLSSDTRRLLNEALLVLLRSFTNAIRKVSAQRRMQKPPKNGGRKLRNASRVKKRICNARRNLRNGKNNGKSRTPNFMSSWIS